MFDDDLILQWLGFEFIFGPFDPPQTDEEEEENE